MSVSAFFKMEAQNELSGNCTEIIIAGFQLGSMFPSMTSYYFMEPLYSTAFNHERDSTTNTKNYRNFLDFNLHNMQGCHAMRLEN